MTTPDDELTDDPFPFADEDGGDFLASLEDDTAPAGEEDLSPWRMLVVDDESGVHSVTLLALEDFSFRGRALEFLHAYSGEEARKIFETHDDIAICLLDVVMESDDAGLQVVTHVRDRLHNNAVRIILRTGQPGQAPEQEIVTRYDINDYKHKTELTRQKLFTLVHANLQAYCDLVAVREARAALPRLLAGVHAKDGTAILQAGTDQIGAVLGRDRGLLCARVADGAPGEIIAATGLYADLVGQTVPQAQADHPAMAEIAKADGQPCHDERTLICTHGAGNTALVFFLHGIALLGPDDADYFDTVTGALAQTVTEI